MDYGTLKWKTFPERLEENGISWKCYQNEVAIDTGFDGEEDPWLSNFQDNPLEFFGQYNIHLHPKHIEALEKRTSQLPQMIDELQKKIDAMPSGDAHIDHLKHQLKELQGYLEGVKKEKETYKAGQFESLSDHEKDLHRKAFDTNVNDPDHRALITLKYDDNGTEREMQVPKGDVLYQFRDDVKNGKLPTVSWISAPEHFSDHPSSAWYGAWYVSEALDILTQNPEVWKKTIFILAYDENDGYFDHVPPFTAPHSQRQETGKVSKGIDTRVDFVSLEQEKERKGFPEPFARECSIGLGYRVPLVIASPWSKGGYVNSEIFDHTSTLQFLEHFLTQKTGKKIVESNISDWRRTVCGDLTSTFRPYNGGQIASPEFVKKDPFVEGIHRAQFKKLPSDYKLLTKQEIAQTNYEPHASPHLPQQEKGIRPSCALPYELYADGELSADKKFFEINFSAANKVWGDKTIGAPFNVYAPGSYLNTKGKFENVRTWAYGLTAGDSLTDQWPIEEFEDKYYHLRVYGPNGFFREFKGDIQDPSIHVEFDYQRGLTDSKELTGNLVLSIANQSNKSQIIDITDHAYKTNNHQKAIPASGKATIVLNLEKSHSWYDFSIKVSGHQIFEKRYAGRVETRLVGYTDPFMGRVVT